MKLQGKCCYILSAAGVHPQTFCLNPTGYVMARNADDNRVVRVYLTMCPEHLRLTANDDDD